MESVADVRSLEKLTAWLGEWLGQRVLTVESAAQLGAVALVVLLALALRVPVRALFLRVLDRLDASASRQRTRAVVESLVVPLVSLALLGVCLAVARDQGHPDQILRILTSLLTAWVVIHIASSFLADPFWSQFVAVTAWAVAALNILNLLAPTITLLDRLAVTIGQMRVSLYLVIKGLVLATILLTAAFSVSRIFQSRVQRLPRLTPSLQVLISQTVKFTLVTLAVVVALGSVGIDLTALAFFGGAVGVGIGFGLQKVVSNVVSGIILLIDGSIKPGDVIEVGTTYGWVNSLGARYASIVTRDGTEHLIPNEEFITQRVVNWSFSDSHVRRRVPIGISYDSDLDLATRLIIEATHEVERVLKHPQPVCLLMGFGDSSVDLEARFWIADPQLGTANVADDVLRRVWRKFHEHGVTIPFPQRDLHLKSPGRLEVEIHAAGGSSR